MSRLKSCINHFWLGLCHGPRWGSLRRSPRHVSGWGWDTLPIPPLCLRHLASERLWRLDLGARA